MSKFKIAIGAIVMIIVAAVIAIVTLGGSSSANPPSTDGSPVQVVKIADVLDAVQLDGSNIHNVGDNLGLEFSSTQYEGGPRAAGHLIMPNGKWALVGDWIVDLPGGPKVFTDTKFYQKYRIL